MLKKLISIVTVAAATSVMIASCADKEITRVKSREPVTGEFKTTVLDVGKADAMLLETAGHTVIIDTGESNDGDEIVEYLNEHGIERVDYMFITHFDKDHVGGAPEIIENIEIGKIITPDYEGNNKGYERFIKALENSGIETSKLTENKVFVLDDAVFEVYPPEKSAYAEEDNDFSLVINVTHGENSFMFAGDCETVRLAELPSQMDMEHVFLKVPHHGIYCDGMDEFIESVSPKYAVITDSAKNPADEEVLSLLDGIGCEILETIYGNITVVSDGEEVNIIQ